MCLLNVNNKNNKHNNINNNKNNSNNKDKNVNKNNDEDGDDDSGEKKVDSIGTIEATIFQFNKGKQWKSAQTLRHPASRQDSQTKAKTSRQNFQTSDSSRIEASDAVSKQETCLDKLEFAGRQYHSQCANFWLNCVDGVLPSLSFRELL